MIRNHPSAGKKGRARLARRAWGPRRRAVFARWEATFSRFLPDSELSRVNASPRAALPVSSLFGRALRVALRIARATGGLVDPTLGAALEAAGIHSPATGDIRQALWNKLVLNLASSTLCLLAEDTVAGIGADPALAALLERIRAEGRAIATAHGIRVENAPRRPGGAPSGAAHKPSMLQDYERGRPMEIEAQVMAPLAFARAAGHAAGLPVMPVHHMEGHLLAPGITGQLPPFPFMSLLVSGGHTLLVRVDGIGRYTVVGQTIDDAAGECFDKSARLLGLPYPGGPEIARLAADGDARRFALPRPMLKHDNLDFSFSGLKTAVMLAAHSCEGAADRQWRHDLAAAVEAAIVDVLVTKSVRACRREGVQHLVVAGGVAANARLRAQLAAEAEAMALAVYLPDPRYCTDNGAMIAYAGYRRAHAIPESWDARARWPLEEA